MRLRAARSCSTCLFGGLRRDDGELHEKGSTVTPTSTATTNIPVDRQIRQAEANASVPPQHR